MTTTSTNDDVKQRFAATFGQKIEIELETVAHISTHTLQGGKRTTFRFRSDTLAPESPVPRNFFNECVSTPILNMCGVARTDGDGVVEFSLSDYFCRRDLPEAFSSPAIVVASPTTHEAVHVTISARVNADDKDVTIRASTWDANGSPAPQMSFGWMCQVPTLSIIDG